MAADKTEIKKRIAQDTDYVRCPKCSNSLTKFLQRNPDGVEDNTVARLLMIPEDQVEQVYQEAVLKLRESLKIESDK